MTLFHFSASRYIIGKKGETKKRLETETRTSISIPKPGVEGEIGEPKTSILSAALTQTRFEGAQGAGGAFLQFLLLAQPGSPHGPGEITSLLRFFPDYKP